MIVLFCVLLCFRAEWKSSRISDAKMFEHVCRYADQRCKPSSCPLGFTRHEQISLRISWNWCTLYAVSVGLQWCIAQWWQWGGARMLHGHLRNTLFCTCAGWWPGWATGTTILIAASETILVSFFFSIMSIWFDVSCSIIVFRCFSRQVSLDSMSSAVTCDYTCSLRITLWSFGISAYHSVDMASCPVCNSHVQVHQTDPVRHIVQDVQDSSVMLL